MYKQIAENKRHTVLILAGFLALIFGIGALVAWWLDDWEIAVWVFCVAGIYALIQYFFAAKLTVAMSGAREITKKDNRRLYNIVENLSLTAGLPMPKVYLITDPSPNAFASGRDPDHALVAATTGLLDIMDDKELTSVMAHEMSHVKNYDIRVSTITFGLVCMVGLITDLGLRLMVFGSSRDSKNQSPVGLVIMLVVAILSPIAAAIAQMAVSREREYLADASAVNLTRDPDGMIGALKKLSVQGSPMRKQNSAMEALYINNPLKKGGISNLFSTHPPLEKRIERLEHGKWNF